MPPPMWLPSTLPCCSDYGKLLESKGERPVSVKRCETVEEVLKLADVSGRWHAVAAGWWRCAKPA